MPIPTPKKEETKNDFISRCIKFLKNENSRTANEIIAICFDQWDRKKR
jgi:hypothetical protein